MTQAIRDQSVCEHITLDMCPEGLAVLGPVRAH